MERYWKGEIVPGMVTKLKTFAAVIGSPFKTNPLLEQYSSGLRLHERQNKRERESKKDTMLHTVVPLELVQVKDLQQRRSSRMMLGEIRHWNEMLT